MKHVVPFLSLVAALIGLSSARSQDSEFYKKPTTPAEFWRALQFEIGVGKFDVAAAHLRGLLDANPTDADLLEIEGRSGLTAFLRLRNVERWSRDKPTDAEARANVEKLIERVSTALKNELANPARITKFARNLSATPEEAAYALKELTRSGVEAIPILVDMLRGNQPASQRAAILEALTSFDISTVPALVAALDAPEASLKLELLDSLRRRPDYLTFSTRVETDLRPHLWYFSAPLAKNPEILRARAKSMLQGLLDRDPNAERVEERRSPQYQLNQLANTFLDHTARFTPGDQVTVWKWENDRPTPAPMSVSDAEEYYGLRYAKRALEIQNDYIPAQKTFLTLALEKHFARTPGEAPLSQTSPGLYGILATAPYSLLTELTEQYLAEKRVPLAVSVLQVLGDRSELKAARVSDGNGTKENDVRLSLLLKALDHPDRRVRFAAVDSLLKMPGNAGHHRAASIVKILSGMLQADTPEAEGKARVLIGDADQVRAEMMAGVMRRAGFRAEVARTGRDLMRRLQAKADIDLVVLDLHIPYPMFGDTLAQLKVDFRTSTLPVLVVASPDQPTTAHPITLLGRLAALAAASEHADFLRSEQLRDDPRRASPANRFQIRLDTLRGRVEAAGIRVSGDVADRLEYLIYLTAPVGEFPLPLELERSRLFLTEPDRTNRMLALQTDPRRGHIAVNESPFPDTQKYTPALAAVVARHEQSLPENILQLADGYWRIIQNGQRDKGGKVLQEPLPSVAIIHQDVINRARRISVGHPKAKVIPEVFTEDALRDALQGFYAMQDPKVMEADRRANAKSAMRWLHKMATGELPGYPVVDALPTLRLALQDPELASLAIDTVYRLPGKETQQDLAGVILGGLDPAIRLQATDALIRHVQQRGRMLTPEQIQMLMDRAATEPDAPLKGRLQALVGVIATDPKATGNRLLEFTPMPPAEPKKEEPKN